MENYNKKFKNFIGMKPNMPSALYIDNIVEETLDNIKIIREIEDKNNFKNQTNNQNINRNIENHKNTESFGIISEQILKTLEKEDIIDNEQNIILEYFNHNESLNIKEKNLNLENVSVKENHNNILFNRPEGNSHNKISCFINNNNLVHMIV